MTNFSGTKLLLVAELFLRIKLFLVQNYLSHKIIFRTKLLFLIATLFFRIKLLLAQNYFF